MVEQERARVPNGGKASLLKLSGMERELLVPVAHGGAGRLRVAYMSSDFGGHTVGSLIRNLLKLHNRKRCEVCGVGMMKGDGTEWNMEMEASTDRWLSIHGMSDQAAAFAIDALEVHILIDLNGHSKGARLGVLLRRPAPIIIRSSPVVAAAPCVGALRHAPAHHALAAPQPCARLQMRPLPAEPARAQRPELNARSPPVLLQRRGRAPAPALVPLTCPALVAPCERLDWWRRTTLAARATRRAREAADPCGGPLWLTPVADAQGRNANR